MVLNGQINAQLGKKDLAEIYFNKAKGMLGTLRDDSRKTYFYRRYIPFLISTNRIAEAKLQTEKTLGDIKTEQKSQYKVDGCHDETKLVDALHQPDSAYYFSKLKRE